MKKNNSIIDKSLTYVSPTVIEMAFESEGLLCQSRLEGEGTGGEDFGEGGDFDFGGLF